MKSFSAAPNPLQKKVAEQDIWPHPFIDSDSCQGALLHSERSSCRLLSKINSLASRLLSKQW